MTGGYHKKTKKFIEFKDENDTLISINREHIVAIQEDEPKITYVYVDVHDSTVCPEIAAFRVKGSYKKIRELLD